MGTYIRNTCSIWFKHLLGHYTAFYEILSFCNDKRIGNWFPLKPLLFSDKCLEMLNLEYLGNELQFISLWCRKKFGMIFDPI